MKGTEGRKRQNVRKKREINSKEKAMKGKEIK
jgi:hypothetical protein